MDAPLNDPQQLSLLGTDDRLAVIRSMFSQWPAFGELLIRRRVAWLAKRGLKRDQAGSPSGEVIPRRKPLARPEMLK